ncbi:MAG: caspase family protein [Planctomycetia bacterium]|nr:caspase family protein [Planctomycetia bacterium]
MTKLKIFIIIFSIVTILSFSGCKYKTLSEKETAQLMSEVPSSASSADDMLIVDCLLPGQIRKLGNMTYLTPRRAMKTTALVCRIRGGEYVAYDRANYETALKVWVSQAEGGDKIAQTYVGEIYEKGLGREPDYALAARWYKKAAEQGYASAQINLGHLYEKGLGVERNMAEALKWYRKAFGLEDAISIDPASIDTEMNRRFEELRQEVDRRKKQEELLQNQMEQIQKQLEQSRQELKKKKEEADIGNEDKEISELRQKITQLEGEAKQHKEQLKTLQQEEIIGPTIEMIDPRIPAMQYPEAKQVRGIRLEAKQGIPRIITQSGTERVITGRVIAPSGLQVFTVNNKEQNVDESGAFKVPVKVQDSDVQVTLCATDKQGRQTTQLFVLALESQFPKQKKWELPPAIFGNYHALIIGNEQYTYWDDLDTPKEDAEEVAKILKNKYGFKTKIILNATRFDILKALNEYQRVLAEGDNLLIYYAGHGYLDTQIVRGYWIPVDGDREVRANWVTTIDITDMISIMGARHILLVSDSCYSGMLTRSAIPQIESAPSDEIRHRWTKVSMEKKSRTVLTSGDLEPVLDSGGGGHSVFAKALLGVLIENEGVLEGMRLYKEVSARLAHPVSSAVYVGQVPQYAPLQYSGHEMGEFFFRPVGKMK